MSTWRMAGLKKTLNTLAFWESLRLVELLNWRKNYVHTKNNRIFWNKHIFLHNYVNYSNIAAKTLRKSLKSNLKEEALKRDQSFIKYYYWVNGNQLPHGEKPKIIEKEKT